MTKSEIEEVLERVRTWPPERQEDAVAMLLRMEGQGAESYEPTEDEKADLEEALAEAEREEPVPDDEVRALFERYRRP
jgi:hypothetical protein